MFKILDGRSEFYQWDLNRKIVVDDASMKEVHFCNRTGSCSLVRDVYEVNGLYVADVPNILLQDNWDIKVYGFDTSYTKHAITFNVVARTKPESYIYTETEQLKWEQIEERIDQIEENGVSQNVIKETVEKYLEENDINVDLTGYATESYVDEQISKVQTTPGKDGKDGVSVTHSWNGTTLTVTSASGTSSANLVGPQGPEGPQGPAGKDGTMSFTDLTAEQKESLRGPEGKQGPVGPQGPEGPQGPKGADGTMTFEELTEEQRESLRGPQGIQGPQGEPGKDGKDGAPGEQGPQGEQGIQGPIGETGPQGEPGVNGKDGEDYVLTETDKSEIANIVLAILPVAEEVSV